MKKLLVTAVAGVAVVTAGFGLVSVRGTANANNAAGITGVWEVTAVAPYAPHLFTFNRDGTMLSTNPTNVQENPAKPNGGTNDSVGMGVWRVVNQDGHKYVVGTFEELNALADNHLPTDKLSVSFKVQVGSDGNSFDGPASATVGSETNPSHLTGARVTVDEDAVNAL